MVVYNGRFGQPLRANPQRPADYNRTITLEQPNHKPAAPPSVSAGGSVMASPTVYWRVEGSLLDLTVVEPVAFFTWNAQTFTERFRRRGLIFLMAALRPFLYSTNRKFATRGAHTVLRGGLRARLARPGESVFL